MADAGAATRDSFRDTTRYGDVVVFDQHGVIKAEAMIASAAGFDRIFSNVRSPGVVFRVQQILALCGLAA